MNNLEKNAKREMFENIVESVAYKPGWYFRHGLTGSGDDQYMWLQVGVTAEADISWDMIEGKKVPWRGAKMPLSWHMCRQEVVGTIFHAIERAEQHEMKEWFRYRGRAIYNPHVDPDALVGLTSKLKNFNFRENAMTMDES